MIEASTASGGETMPWMTGPGLGVALVAALAVQTPTTGAQTPRLPDGEAVIGGPGLDRPLVLTGEPFFTLVYLAGLVPDWSPPPPGRRVAAPSLESLGASYDVLYSFPVPGQGPAPVVQALYPASPGGALVHTPARHGIPLPDGGRLDVRPGWWRSRVLPAFLRGLALAEGITVFPPRDAPAAATTPEETRPTASRRTGTPQDGGRPDPGARVLAALAAFGALFLLGALGSRPGKRKS